MGIYEFNVLKANGEAVSLSEYKSKVVLIINSATECGFTPQYSALQELYEKYKEEGLEILDFPCNQFGKQAPGSNEEIVSFCEGKYGIKFPIFSKIEINGENASPLYKYLIKEKGFAGFDEAHPLASKLISILDGVNADYASESDIKWNFTKFLVDRSGNVVERFEPTTDISVVEDRIKKLL